MFGVGREARAAEAACATFLSGVGRGLGIGKKLPALPGLQTVTDPAAVEALGGQFDGVLWRVSRSLREGMTSLRPHLAPGARLFLLVELVPSVWGITRELLGGREIARFTKEGICEEVLLLGLGSPRVWADSARFLAVSAHMPAHPDALDQVFSQPRAG